MANTLDNLIPDVYAALDVVSRELVGAIPGVSRDSTADGVAVNQTLRVHKTVANTAGGDVVPAMALPAAANQTVGNTPFTIEKSRFMPFSWTGEEQYGMDQGPGFLSIQQGQIAQAIRGLTNEMESDVCTELALGGSRAYGTAGTTPFASSLADTAQVRKILDDNGAPASGRSLVIDTSAGAALRTLQHLTKVNESGSSMTLRDGALLDVHGFTIRESAQILNQTAGTGTSYVLDGAGSEGDTVISIDTGSGTVVVGDIVTIDGNKYVVTVGVAAPGDITIAAPGLVADVADTSTVTVNATSARNIAFSPDACLLGTRIPIMPKEGDLAIDSQIITDPRTGISFDLRVYPGVGMVTYRLQAAWGVQALKPEHAAILLG